MVKRFCQIEEWSEKNFIFCQKRNGKGYMLDLNISEIYAGSMVQYLQHRLLKWFDENQRIFPWRERSGDEVPANCFWKSCLQRTKAETVAKYYDTFSPKFPDWNAFWLMLRLKSWKRL